jgi:MFS family permease
MTEWGLITTIMSVVGFLISMPSGMVADKFDRVKLNIVARGIYPITTIGYIYLRNFWLVLGTRMIAGVGMGLSGAAETATIGGPAWQSLMADIVPAEKRGRVSGFMSTVSGIIALPAPYVGAYMWDNPGIGPENTMWAGILLGIASTGYFAVYVKDPRSEKKSIEQLAEGAGEDDGEEKKRGDQSN